MVDFTHRQKKWTFPSYSILLMFDPLCNLQEKS
jgi:hypothetical protein